MTEPLAIRIGNLLRQQHKTLALAESCTGGLIASFLTDVPGSSEYFLGSVVAYAYEAKERLLNVPNDLLLEHGAVSEPVTRVIAQTRARNLARMSPSVSRASWGPAARRRPSHWG